MTRTGPDPLGQFTRTAEIAASRVIAQYSTSFGLAVHLLGARHRQHVRNIYALVRVADEIVDGVGHQAGLAPHALRDRLNAYEAEVERALSCGYSTDLIIHAFAVTAREAGIKESLTRPFFESMRSDLTSSLETPDDHARYVYGSAEVVGLMCLRVFLRGSHPTPATCDILETGARRLGAAFQNINFLRDIADDATRLGRDYLTGTAPPSATHRPPATHTTGADARRSGPRVRLTEAQRLAWIESIRDDLAAAERAIPALPHDARAAVRSALALFTDLTHQIATVPLTEIYTRRLHVPAHRKAWLTARAYLTTYREN
ncbi:squalene/phytoene synthase family protein [Micrococcales bacterium 31B]|nr:squalene/phytoene synthase family protein [Micrococcales bacterium 31B]